jgi:hypothetical protein
MTPTQHPEGSKRVHSARFASRLEVKVALAGVPVLNPPSAVRCSTGLDQRDGVRQTLVPDRVDPGEVLESEQDVEVPIARERKF